MNIIQRIYSGFVLLLFILVILGGYSVYSGIQSTEKTDELMLMSKRRQTANDMELAVVQVQQWLTDISATRGMEGFDDGLDEAATYADLFREKVRELERLYAGTQVASTIGATARDFEEYYEMGQKMAHTYIEQGPGEGNKMMEQFDPFAEKLGEGLNKIVRLSGKQQEQALADINDAATTSKWVAIVMMAVGLIGGVATALGIVTTVRNNLKDISENLMGGAREVASASGMISSSAQSLAEGATTQADSLQNTTATLEQISASASQNADHASAADDIIRETEKSANHGVDSMGRMNDAMTNLKESTDEVTKIINVIEEIAFQTNLLALNAAVEAARAGEHGKGFAVVAEEVRNLAQRSATASKDTAALIERAVERSNEGNDIATQVSEDLHKLAEGVKKARANISEIAAASREEADAVSNVNEAVAQIDGVTQETASDSQQAAAASEELNAQSENLFEMVENLSHLIGVEVNGYRKRPSNGGARPGLPPAGRRPAATAKRPAATRPSKPASKPAPQQKAKPAPKKDASDQNPDEIIPFDDMDDF